MQRRTASLSLVALAASGLLGGCKIVPLTQAEVSPGGNFDAGRYASDLWESKAMPFLMQGAHPLPEVLAAIRQDLAAAGQQYGYRPATEGSPWTFIVSGSGTVTKKNTTSRAGTLTVSLDGATPPSEVMIQIGPVVRGNAVRDGLPFVPFKDFTNQLQYADVGKAFTALALEAIGADAASIAEGNQVSFVGAMSLNNKSDKIVVTPVSLKAAT